MSYTERKRTTGRAALKRSRIATDFAPSTLVAQFFGVSDFGLGSTLAFRKADLDRIGGFRAIADYIADDYQLGHKLHALGLSNIISEVVVSTRLSSGSWLGAWRHQVRWAQNDSIVRRRRVRRLADYIRQPVGRDRGAFWNVVDRAAAACDPDGHGHRLRMASAWKRGCLEILLHDPATRSMRRRRVGGRLVGRHGGMARSAVEARRRRENHRSTRMSRALAIMEFARP